MKKRVLIGLLILLFAAVGFGVWRLSQHIIYQNSADRMVDEFIMELTTDNKNAAYSRLTDSLKYNYSENYWKTRFFPQFAHYKETPKLLTKESLRFDPSLPHPYDPATDPQRFVYEFRLNDHPYRLTMVVIKKSSQWQVNELEGKYLSP